MRRAAPGAWAATLILAVAGSGSATAATLESIGPATYDAPTFVTSDPRDPDRLFVTEQPGTIDVTTPAGTSLFLDLDDKVLDGGERGLWSMAFAPDFAQTGRFYVAYSANDGALTLEEYREQATPAATEATRRPVLSIANDFASSNHNGGQLQFGPDGYLYWSTGDDATATHAQTTANLLGKILRIDPRGTTPGEYTVPADNPFGSEIWALGLRNPWRFSFDRTTGALTIGDVGAGAREEVDYLTQASGGGRGANFGWPICEGLQGTSCAGGGLTAPIYDYVSDDSPCNAITGGYVVRDPDLGDLFGRYLFTDSCTGGLRSIDPAAPPATDQDRARASALRAPSPSARTPAGASTSSLRAPAGCFGSRGRRGAPARSRSRRPRPRTSIRRRRGWCSSRATNAGRG